MPQGNSHPGSGSYLVTKSPLPFQPSREDLDGVQSFELAVLVFDSSRITDRRLLRCPRTQRIHPLPDKSESRGRVQHGSLPGGGGDGAGRTARGHDELRQYRPGDHGLRGRHRHAGRGAADGSGRVGIHPDPRPPGIQPVHRADADLPPDRGRRFDPAGPEIPRMRSISFFRSVWALLAEPR